MAKQTWVGGSFAPALTDEALAQYRQLMGRFNSGPAQQLYADCLECVEAWWQLPESTGDVQGFHTFLDKVVVGLDKQYQNTLDPYIPWDYEIEAAKQLLNIDPQLQADPDLKNSFAHLLWHVCELNLVREPVTLDKLS